MSADKVPQDATASTRGTIYHLCVAVQKCYQLREGQRLLIEELGDVTIDGEQQIEVKQYSDCLTDGHHNFWNTLKNWMGDAFDHTRYAYLILHTTQKFAPNATIVEWNGLDAKKRLELLLAINQKSEKAYEKAKVANAKKAPTAVLKHQRFVLHPKRRAKLNALLGKVWIEAQAKNLPDLYEELKQGKIRGILSGKKGDFLDALIGFVCRPDKKAGEQWVITYEDFEAKLANLSTTYCKETRLFPRKYFTGPGSGDGSPDRDDLFVTKIRDIEYPDVICEAIHDYEATLATVNREFKAYGVDPAIVEDYSREVEGQFAADYRVACRRCSDELPDSQDLYDGTTSRHASALPGFEDTPCAFRNGLLHQRMDNPSTDLKWRVSRNE